MFVEDKAHGEPSVEGLLEFAKSKDPKETFAYINDEICACAQYAKSIGKFKEWQLERHLDQTIWWQLNNLAGKAVVPYAPEPFDITKLHTFGKLVKVLADV